ncbi:MAG: GNAT family N-acetyltransferase [Streptosporangiaceae bacterium]
MPWVVRDVVHDLNKSVGRRWQGLDRLLPGRADLPEGCAAPLVAAGANGRPAGLGVCRHQFVPAGTLNQTWGSASQFSLILRLREPDTSAALDDLLGQWRDHLAGLPEAGPVDTAAMVTWPARDVSGVNALLRRGMQAMTVIAVRPAEHAAAAGPARPGEPASAQVVAEGSAGLVIREAGLGDLDVVTEFEMGVIRYDAQFGAAIIRPATEALVRAETQAALATRPAWAWLAERDGRPVGLVHVQPPERSGWIASMTRPGVTVYLQTMFVRPGERGSGVGAALVRHVHGVLDARGVQTTLLHYALMNPLSAPFWNRMGYRPLWTGWEVRPAASLR